MHFSLSVAALLAAAGSAVAQTPGYIPVNKPVANEKIAAGSTYTIEWGVPEKYAAGSVNIILIGGATQQLLGTIQNLATVKVADAKYLWSVDPKLGAATIYGFNFTDAADPSNTFQYSNPFSITGGAVANTTTTLTTSSGTVTRTVSSVSTSGSAEPTTTSEAEGGAGVTTSARRTVTSVVTAATTSATTRPNSGARASAGAFVGLAGLVAAALAL
jgi:hypothetical protein